MFTSGSTGLPVPHIKTWGCLVAGARAEADCLGLTGKERHYIVATVPAQHMFGLETSVMQGGSVQDIFQQVQRFMDTAPAGDDCTLLEVCYGRCQ